MTRGLAGWPLPLAVMAMGGACLAAGPARADIDILAEVMAVCGDPSITRAEAHVTLRNAGWYEGSSNQLLHLLAAFSFALQVDSTDSDSLVYSLANAEFLAASQLGNSVLQHHLQTVFTREGHTLALLGFETPTRACVLGGQPGLEAAANGLPNPEPYESDLLRPDPVRRTPTSTTDGVTIVAALLDMRRALRLAGLAAFHRSGDAADHV
jgi:hypothetical protein